MTPDRDMTRLLDRWLADGPNTAPDRVIDVLADRIERSPQRPAWRHRLNDLPVSSTSYRLVLLAAAMSLLLIGGLLVAGNIQDDDVTPTPTPAPTLPPKPTFPAGFACWDDEACQGPLAAGDHASEAFLPRVTFTVPKGWRNLLDTDQDFVIDTLDIPAPDVRVMTHLVIPEQDATCDRGPAQGVGGSVDDWVHFLTTHPGLDATATPIEIDGYTGSRVRFQVKRDWPLRCPGVIRPTVVVGTGDGPSPRTWWYDDSSISTYHILDVAGQTVIIAVDTIGFDEVHDRILGAAQPVIDSFRFEPGG